VGEELPGVFVGVGVFDGGVVGVGVLPGGDVGTDVGKGVGTMLFIIIIIILTLTIVTLLAPEGLFGFARYSPSFFHIAI